jgi:hypothetical protein
MRSKLLIGALLASAVSLPALAQQSPPPAATPAPATRTETTAAPMATTGQWRASKLIGVDVYNEQNEKLGDIDELLVDASGKVTGVVIGVGGFLGMGQRDIMVAIDKLKFVNEPVRTSATSTTTSQPAGNTTGSARTTTTTTTSANDKKWYPDHAVLAGASKDQLKTMPEFKY